IVRSEPDQLLVLRDGLRAASVPSKEERVIGKHGPVVWVLAQIGTIKYVSVGDMPEISRVAGLDNQALTVSGSRGERQGLFVFFFPLDRRVSDVAEIVIAQRRVGHGKV